MNLFDMYFEELDSLLIIKQLSDKHWLDEISNLVQYKIDNLVMYIMEIADETAIAV